MKHLKIFSSILIFAALYFFIYSCSCSSCGKKEEATVPLDILKKANAFIISRTGETFFNSYITPDFSRTKHTPPYYEMVYRFYMPEKPFVNNKITFTVDSTGNVVKKRDIIGIPVCNDFPSQCDWKIDKESAVSIAKKNNLEDGVNEWKVGFIWNPERQIYVWNILSTIHEMEGDFGYRGSGKEMIIDPVNGEVLAINDWHIR
jgi:hypothetical protein